MPQINTEATIKDGVTLNILLSISMPFLLSLLSGSVKVTIIINIIMMTKTQLMRFKNGIASIAPPDICGRYLNNNDNGITITADTRAALDVVFFQKKPNKNIANIPGEINPTHSCINW